MRHQDHIISTEGGPPLARSAAAGAVTIGHNDCAGATTVRSRELMMTRDVLALVFTLGVLVTLLVLVSILVMHFAG